MSQRPHSSALLCVIQSRALGLRRAAAITLALVTLVPGAALARSAGVVSQGCDACHTGGKPTTVTITADPAAPAVGEAVTLTIGVAQTNGSSAGFYLMTAFDVPGAFQTAESGTGLASGGVLHTSARTATGGTTYFKTRWTATEATGVEFNVFALSGNGDRSNRGDGAGTAKLQLLVGCTGTTYYIDQDGDGVGSTDPVYATRKDCKQPLGYAPKTGDCDDFQAKVFPGAVEQCDLKDNDCDGQVDNSVVNQAYCEDLDGDGHGRPGGPTKMDCKPSAGFGDCEGDCDDRSASVHPGAEEVCNGRDDDCDGDTDEGVRAICGVGLCARYATGCSTECTPGAPFAETCNGYDDDCDGVIDNGTSAQLCGDANVPCVQGKCDGVVTTPVGGSGAGGSSSLPVAGGSSVAGAAPSGPSGPSGLSGSQAGSGCAVNTRGVAASGGAWLGLLGALGLGWLRRGRRVPSEARRAGDGITAD